MLTHVHLQSFLNGIKQIAMCNYQPTDADMIQAHLPTPGIQEYKFMVEHGAFHYFPLLQ